MVKLFKVLLSAIVFIAVVLAIAIGLIVYFIDPNSLKPIIISEVAKKTGYQLSMNGKLSWTLYPHLAINIPDMTVTEPKQKEAFVELKSIKAATPLAALLRGEKNISGDLRIDEIVFMKMHIHDAVVSMRWHDKSINLAPITAKLYDGNLKGTASGSHLNENPKWAWDVSLTHIQLQKLLADLTRNNKLQLSGLGQIKVVATSKGKSKEAIISNMNGNAQFSADQGKVEGINLDYFIESADALLNKRQVQFPTNLNETQFQTLTASAVITNGVAKTQDILLRSQALTATGTGNINLNNNTLVIALIVKAIQPTDSKRAIPPLTVNVSGALTNPNTNVDMSEVEKMVTKEVIDRVRDKIEDKISKFLGN